MALIRTPLRSVLMLPARQILFSTLFPFFSFGSQQRYGIPITSELAWGYRIFVGVQARRKEKEQKSVPGSLWTHVVAGVDVDAVDGDAEMKMGAC